MVAGSSVGSNHSWMVGFFGTTIRFSDLFIIISEGKFVVLKKSLGGVTS